MELALFVNQAMALSERPATSLLIASRKIKSSNCTELYIEEENNDDLIERRLSIQRAYGMAGSDFVGIAELNKGFVLLTFIMKQMSGNVCIKLNNVTVPPWVIFDEEFPFTIKKFASTNSYLTVSNLARIISLFSKGGGILTLKGIFSFYNFTNLANDMNFPDLLQRGKIKALNLSGSRLRPIDLLSLFELNTFSKNLQLNLSHCLDLCAKLDDHEDIIMRFEECLQQIKKLNKIRLSKLIFNWTKIHPRMLNPLIRLLQGRVHLELVDCLMEINEIPLDGNATLETLTVSRISTAALNSVMPFAIRRGFKLSIFNSSIISRLERTNWPTQVKSIIIRACDLDLNFITAFKSIKTVTIHLTSIMDTFLNHMSNSEIGIFKLFNRTPPNGPMVEFIRNNTIRQLDLGGRTFILSASTLLDLPFYRAFTQFLKVIGEKNYLNEHVKQLLAKETTRTKSHLAKEYLLFYLYFLFGSRDIPESVTQNFGLMDVKNHRLTAEKLLKQHSPFGSQLPFELLEQITSFMKDPYATYIDFLLSYSDY